LARSGEASGFSTQRADLLSLSRSRLYDQPVPPSPEEVALKHHIDRLSKASPFYGSQRIADALHREGVSTNRKAVQRHMPREGQRGQRAGSPPGYTPAPASGGPLPAAHSDATLHDGG